MFDNSKHAHPVRCAIVALACIGGTAAALAQPTTGDINLNACEANKTYAAKPGETLDTSYGISGASGNIFVALAPDGSGCMGSQSTLTCNPGVTVQAPPQDPTTGAPATARVTMKRASPFTMADLGAESKWITTPADLGGKSCPDVHYRFHVTSSGGGWGDPHLTTVDGVHYDFQSAGEFTALRKEGLEIQTRQTAVPTATVPITNAYTGITHCVAIYTAVAAKFGASRITLQPGLKKNEADPKTMQLRINGTLTELTDRGIELKSGDGSTTKFDGRIRRAAGGVIEMTDAGGTQLVVTPAYWDPQKVWYLNVAVYQTSAVLGTMGKISPDGWLPALPDGSSLGPKPESENQRYEALYTKFAGAWRVTDTSTLFDYAPGENTGSFTYAEWPRNHPESCGIEGQTSVQGTTAEAAAQACAGVTDASQKADCQFDVAITGNTGFGKAYETSQAYQPAGTGWAPVVPGGGTPPWWKTWWWLIVLILLLLFLLFWLLSRRRSGP